MSAPPSAPRWLLLAHQLPARPSNARVKTWRRLQQIGAVPARNSVYVLPNTEQCREDFEWIRSEIVALGGEATVFAADVLDAHGAEDLVSAFQHARDADYRALTRDAQRLASQAGGTQTASSAHDTVGRAVRHLRERLAGVRRADFFAAPGSRAAAAAVSRLEERIAPPIPEVKEVPVRVSAKKFTGRRWVTRPRPGVDRMASAWLIRRFIDPDATFRFADRPDDDEVAFDMYVGDFSHQGALCTFETLAQRFGLTDAAVVRLGEIVHDLDMKDTRYAAPEVPAVGRMVDGLRQVHGDDAALLEQGMAMFEALARSFGGAESGGGARHAARPVRKAGKSPRRA